MLAKQGFTGVLWRGCCLKATALFTADVWVVVIVHHGRLNLLQDHLVVLSKLGLASMVETAASEELLTSCLVCLRWESGSLSSV